MILQDSLPIKLKKVTKMDHRFLYQILKERNSIVNISHRKMPTYKQHVQFVMSKPYSKWYVVYYEGKKIGSAYLSKQDEIGIFLKKEIQGKGIGHVILQLLIKTNPRPKYLANINPKNTKSIQFFKKNGFRLIQYTYEFNVLK
jgi:RimJ/RimL family protein N-acetyltransferase